MSLQQKIIEKINSEYNLGTCLSVQENNVGRQTHYILETVKGRYFIKVLNCKNTNIHKEDEIIACNTLRKKGLNIVPQYIPRKDNTYLTQIEEKIYFNVQSFINGQTWKKYSAPFWLLIAGAELIADIHCLLQGNSLKQRTAIQNINKTDISLNRLDEIEKEVKNNAPKFIKDFLLYDIGLRKGILEKQKQVNLSSLTFVNGHSDYTVTQIITADKHITGLVDFSEVSNIPAIWEIVRFYVNSASECKKQYISQQSFTKFYQTYSSKIRLNQYDKEMLFLFNLYYFCQALSVYDKLFTTHYSTSYIDRIVSRNNTIKALQAISNF